MMSRVIRVGSKIHYAIEFAHNLACGDWMWVNYTFDKQKVTCKNCRKTKAFKKKPTVHYKRSKLSSTYAACGLFVFTGGKFAFHKTTWVRKNVTCKNCCNTKWFRK